MPQAMPLPQRYRRLPYRATFKRQRQVLGCISQVAIHLKPG